MTAKVVEQQADTVKDSKVLMRSYRSKSDDATCAHNGIVATIINGEAILVAQNRILDAGFNDLVGGQARRGSTSHGFSYRLSVGASRGILTLWDSSEVEVWSTESRAHVYAPCDDVAKQELWDSLSIRIQLVGKRVCLWGFQRCSFFLRSGVWRGLTIGRWLGLEDYPTIVPWSCLRTRKTGVLARRECFSVGRIFLAIICSCVRSGTRFSINWQQSRSLWLKEGDANSKYFHSVLEGRHRRNTMTVVQASNVERPEVDDLQFKRMNQVESVGLTKPFSEAEVKSVVWDCDSYKSPGLYGINFGFIKDLWVELRGDIMHFLSDFHRNDKLTKGINSTFIALIPKIDSPQRLIEFRPISLVESLYKILAKVLANRLRLVIGSVISESHTAFVISEVVDEARKSKKELMLFKVDFEKACDSVDWGYLDDVMGRMSFPTLWQKWIRECVCTATTFVLVNGSPLMSSLFGMVLGKNLFMGYHIEVMFAATKKTEFVAEAVVAEALGLCWGLQIARDLNLGNIIFEMDASLVMDCFKDLLSLS
ncbi:cysteine-rich receptor-like protein kinase, partial [Trifolium pratense]